MSPAETRSVIIAGDFPFPAGTAAAARLRNLAEGMSRCGSIVHVLALANEGKIGAFTRLSDGVSYSPSLPTSAPYRNKGLRRKLRWLVDAYSRSWSACSVMRELVDKGDVSAVLLYGRSYLRLRPLVRLAQAKGIPVFIDCVEITSSFAGLGGRLSPVRWDWIAGAKSFPRLVDGMSVITTKIDQIVRSRGCRHTHLLPSAEDFSAPPTAHPAASGPFRVAYMGAMLPRDNPAFLADLVDALASRGSSVQFDIAGRYEAVKEAEPFARRLAAHVASGRVRLHGKLSDEALAAVLNQADALIMPRRDAPPEVAAFPTRLAECLKTARPVLACAVGDIPLHLRDGEDAVLLDPADPAAAAAKVEALAALPDRGRALGVRGYLRGRERFDRAVHAHALLDLAARLRRQ